MSPGHEKDDRLVDGDACLCGKALCRWITDLDKQQEITLVRITVPEREVEHLNRFLQFTHSDLCESTGNIAHSRWADID